MNALQKPDRSRRLERDENLPLIDFCRERGMSLRSRVAVLEQVCGAVAQAHAMSLAFQPFDASSIAVDYVDGQLTICIGETVPAPRAARVDCAINPFPTADLLIASNLIFLGRVMREIAGDELATDEALATISARANAVGAADRYSSVSELRDRLREWLSPADSQGSGMSWTWA